MENQIRVLHVTTVLKAAGIESFIMNVYRHIDREKVQFDFMVMRDEEEFYDQEIKALGGVKHTIQAHAKNIFVKVIKESRALYQFLKKHPYDIVQVHYTTPLRAFYLLAAKKAGVKVRIYHSHSAEVSGKHLTKRIVYQCLRNKIKKWATDYFACSKVAAEWMFPKSLLDSGAAKVIYNGINIERFRYNEASRAEIRRAYGLDNRFVMIHTGRFLEQKNHAFILKVFEEVKKQCADAKLLLLGTGDLFEEIKKKAEDARLTEDVIFMGVRSDVERYLSAADCYIMPSLYEGLPVAAVEAECAGLPCVFSTNITQEAALTDRVTFLDLDQPIGDWSEAVLKCRHMPKTDCSSDIRAHGYDIQSVADELQRFYQTALER